LDRWTDFARYFPTIEGVFYAICYVKSPKKQRVQLRLGTSGAYKLLLNDHQVGETIDENNNDLDTYINDVTLQEGWNKVLVKCDNSELTRCNFLLRITDAAGQPIKGLQYSTERQSFTPAKPEASAVPIPHIQYFQQCIKREPERLDHYIILAEAHLRNDQVNEAEVVMRDAVRRAPECIVLLMQTIDAYQRSNRNDDVISTIERIVSLRPDLPISLVYAYQRARSNDRLDDAERIVEKFKAIRPRSIDYYDMAIGIANDRSRYNDVQTLQTEAFETHPGNVRYTGSAAIKAIKTTGTREAALEVIERHLQANYGESGLLMKAGVLEDAGRFQEWEAVFEKLFELSPSAPGYHMNMARSYASRRDYAKALSSVEKALADAPSVSNLWLESGKYRRTLGEDDKARSDFEKAIACDPSNFDAREALRELKGLPSPMTLTMTYNIDSLRAAAPTAADHPDADAIYLLDEARRVVFDGSRSEEEFEQLVRVFNKSGIDRYKESYLPGNGLASLKVEKAVVIKADGLEIPADVNRRSGEIVFKGIEPGDFIYVKTRGYSYNVGALSQYFTDDFAFNGASPVLIARYQLLVPDGTAFQWRMSNSFVDMQSKETEYGTLYYWELKNEPKMVTEESMPDYDAVAKMLQVSSIPRWEDLVGWYYDIARTKSRSSMPIRELMDSLCPPDRKFSKMEVIERVYKYITSEIRYSSVPFRQTAFVPQKARDVLATRIGDCKDVATLCISMLAERDVKAYHVLLKTNSYGYTRPLLPSIAFDHDIVMAELGDDGFFMDLTAENVPLRSVPFADLDALCLVIKPGWQLTAALDRKRFTPNNIIVQTEMRLHDDLSASIKQTVTHTGARTQFYRGSWQEATEEELEKSLLEGLSSNLPEVDLKSHSIRYLDTLHDTLSYTLEYDVPFYAMEAADLLIVKLPWYSTYEADPALSYEKRTQPLVRRNYSDTITERIILTIPEAYEGYGVEAMKEFKNSMATVRRTASMKNSTLTFTRQQVNMREVVLPTDYVDYRSYYNSVLRADRQALLLAPDGTVVVKPKNTGAQNSRDR
jgi:tetratricopeptide (TPR) repeat protein